MVSSCPSPPPSPDLSPSDDSSSAKAHEALRDAGSSLANLADWCQSNYRPSPANTSVAFDEANGDVRGGESFHKTVEFAVRALQAVSTNVLVLSESLNSRLSTVAEDLDVMTTEVTWLGLAADVAREKQARTNISKITTKKDKEQPRQSAVRLRKQDEAARPYIRRPFDPAVLNEVGLCGGQKQGTRTPQKQSPDLQQQRRAGLAVASARPFASVKRSDSRLTVASAMSATAMKMPVAPVAPVAVVEETAEAEMRRKKSFQLDARELDVLGELNRLSLLPPMPDLFDDVSSSAASTVDAASVHSHEDVDQLWQQHGASLDSDELGQLLAQMDQLKIDIDGALEQ